MSKTNTTAVKIGNLVTEMHNVLNRFYSNDKDRKKAIRNMVEKIYNSGWLEGRYNSML
jgi:hypothetical protein